MIIAKSGKFALEKEKFVGRHEGTTHELCIVVPEISIVIAHFIDGGIASYGTKLLDYVDNKEDLKDLGILTDIASLILITEEVNCGE